MSLFELHTRVPRILLASGSPRRAQLLQEAGFEIVVAPQDIDETPKPGEHAEKLVERLAYAKAVAARSQACAGDVIIAADTTVAIDGIELGKPQTPYEATRMLTELSGKTHTVATGVCIIVGVGETSSEFKLRSFVVTSDVTFYELSSDDIEAYVASGEPMDKAGAYGIQGLGRFLVERINGDYYNVVGLPVAQTLRVLEDMLK